MIWGDPPLFSSTSRVIVLTLQAIVDLWGVPKEVIEDFHAQELGTVYQPMPFGRKWGVFRLLDKRTGTMDKFEGVKKDEITRIEELMNERVMENASVVTDQMALDQARKAGATALFGEKYGENVRVVNIGDYSQELCGGTHVDNTGEIGLFKIISESSIAAGIRRIEAVTGNEAIAWARQKEETLDRLCGVLETQESTVVQRAEELMQQIKDFKKEVQKANRDSVQKFSSDFSSKAKEVSGVKVVTEVVKGVGIDDLRKTVDSLKKSLGCSSGIRAFSSSAVGSGNSTASLLTSKDRARLHSEYTISLDSFSCAAL